jgi:hypothetical protein
VAVSVLAATLRDFLKVPTVDVYAVAIPLELYPNIILSE